MKTSYKNTTIISSKRLETYSKLSTLQIKGLQAEVRHWQDKHSAMSERHHKLETENTQIQKKLNKTKFSADGRVIDPQIESEVRVILNYLMMNGTCSFALW